MTQHVRSGGGIARLLAVLIALTAMIVVATLGTGAASADGSWLNARPLTQWNTPGMAIPPAPPRPQGTDPRCFDALVVPDTAAKRALVDAGWFLFTFNTPSQTQDVEIVSGQSGADGMCRPTGYQTFVFFGGQFAGTLSPVLMHSRDDGALVQASIEQDGRIDADYVRYTNQDPLCCPSARTTARFEIVQVGGVPVVQIRGAGSVPTTAPTAVPVPATRPPSGAPVQAPAQVPRGR